MNSPRDLLKGLLEYIEEQAKEIDPKGYRLSAAKEFVRRNTDLAGQPGLEFDLRPEGDHIWLHLTRLEAHRPQLFPICSRGYSRSAMTRLVRLPHWMKAIWSLWSQTSTRKEAFVVI